MKEKIELVKYINVDILQEIQDSFSALAGVASGISDDQGSIITNPSGMCDFCAFTRKTKTGDALCCKCDSEAAALARKEGKALFYTCHAGLTDLVAPIIVDDQLVGCFSGGQVRVGAPDEERVLRTAKIIGADPEMYLALARKTREITEEQLIKATNLIHNITRCVSDMANKQYQLEKSRDAIEYAAKLKADFLANMSHELLTPMNGVIGIAELALQEDRPESYRGYVEQIKTSGESLSRTINDVIDFTELEAGKVTLAEAAYDTSALVKDVVRFACDRKEDKDVVILSDIAPDVPATLIGDSGRIRQVLANLVTNAVKFTESGRVTIHMACERKSSSEIDLLLSVEDTGIGIAREDLKKLFRSFLQMDSTRNRMVEGTGLGLVICKHIVDLMNGEIGVESTPGVGSTFHFRIPQKINSTASCECADASDGSLFIAPQAHILIVDDNKVNLTVASGLMRPLQMNMDLAYSGKEALDKVAKKDYDLILMDHMMPEMDGIETTKLIRAQHPQYVDKPIIALTANVESGAREMFLQEGLNDYIPKPVQFKVLLSSLHRWLPKALQIPVNSLDEDNPTESAKETISIKGLDTAYAMSLLGTKDLYMSVLKDYFRLIDKKSALIRQQYETSDWANYTIEVHALKSASRQIGAHELADLATEMERAGNARDIDAIRANTESMLQQYVHYKGVLQPMFGDNDSAKKKAPVEDAVLKGFLNELSEALDNLDMDEMDRLIQEITSYSYDEPRNTIVEKLNDAVQSVDVDAGAVLVAQLFETIG